MPQADTEALLAEITGSRARIDVLVQSITQENEQLRGQAEEAARQIARAGALASALISAVLEIEDKLSETAKAALAEYEALHGAAVTERAKRDKRRSG